MILSIVDGVVCMVLLILSILGIVHFYVYGAALCFESDTDRIGPQLAVVLPGQSGGQGQIQGFYHWKASGRIGKDHMDQNDKTYD